MAKLYGRISGFSHPYLKLRSSFRLVLLGAAFLAVIPIASAQSGSAQASREGSVEGLEAPLEVAEAGDPRLEELRSWSTALSSERQEERAEAFERLTHLGPEMLPAIGARIAQLARRRPEHNWAFDVFTRFRRATGSNRADDDSDAASGVLAVLAQDRHRRVIAMAEPLLLWRSLEAMGTLEACRTMFPLIGLDGDVWRWESRRVLQRMGKDMMAAALLAQRDPNRWTRSWGRLAVERLGAADPGRAVQGLNDRQLADVLQAFAHLRVQRAMRVIVSYVGSEARLVRLASRRAMERYQGNSIWTFRTAYRARTGEHADRAWGWRRVARELYDYQDLERTAESRQILEEGLGAGESGDLDAMVDAFDRSLALAPEPREAGPIAAGYSRLGASLLQSDPSRATWAYRQALRLSPEDEQSESWRANLAFLDAEQNLIHGVWDESGYRRALTLDPGHQPAQEALTALEAGTTSTVSATDPRPRLLAGAAALILLGSILLLLGRSAPTSARPAADIESDEADITIDEGEFFTPGS